MLRRCNSCLIPDTRPDTAFVEGQCSACRNFKARTEIDWPARKVALAKILREAPKNAQGFDCIVPSSGGKDSTYQVMMLLELGATPLVVTATTCQLTPIGRANIDNLARHATTIEVTPNRAVRAKLNRYGLETVGDISYPEHMAIFSIPFQVAVMQNITTIFYGESPQREYGCPEGAEAADAMTRRWVHEFGGLLGLRASDCVGYDGITEQDMSGYQLPPDSCLEGITAYFLGQFIPWDSRRNAAVARQAGMKQVLPSDANWWPAENLDNAQTGIHDHMMYRKYGYGRLCAQISVDIRHGIISREDAFDIVQARDGLFPYKYAGVRYDKVLDQIELSHSDFVKALDQFTNWSLFHRNVDPYVWRPLAQDFAPKTKAMSA